MRVASSDFRGLMTSAFFLPLSPAVACPVVWRDANKRVTMWRAFDHFAPIVRNDPPILDGEAARGTVAGPTFGLREVAACSGAPWQGPWSLRFKKR
jgi:hypothetical protein